MTRDTGSMNPNIVEKRDAVGVTAKTWKTWRAKSHGLPDGQVWLFAVRESVSHDTDDGRAAQSAIIRAARRRCIALENTPYNLDEPMWPYG